MRTREEMLTHIVELLSSGEDNDVNSIDSVSDHEIGVEYEDGSMFFIRVDEA